MLVYLGLIQRSDNPNSIHAYSLCLYANTKRCWAMLCLDSCIRPSQFMVHISPLFKLFHWYWTTVRPPRYQCINLLVPWRCGIDFTNIPLKLKFRILIVRSSCETGLWSLQKPIVNIVSGKGLLTSATSPLLELVLARIPVAIWRQ